MYLEKDYCISVPYKNVNATPIETLDTIKECGFNNVFLKWYDEDWSISQFQQAEYCKKIGLNITFAHLGYQNVSYIWSPDKVYDSFVDRYCNDLDDLKKYDINLAVMHTSGRKQLFTINEIGLNRFKAIVEHAYKLGITIAFENTSFKQDLEYLLDNLKDYDNVGLCFDSGHYHVYFKDDFDLIKYKDRIKCIHLHDNDGLSDQHIIPFDGNINWNNIMKQLDICNYKGPLTLEVLYSDLYSDKISIKEFYTKAYQSMNKLKGQLK